MTAKALVKYFYIAFSLFIFVVLSPATYASTVIVVRTPSEIWAAADSKMIAAPSNETSLTTKIFQVNDLFFGMAGYRKDEHGFDVLKSVQKTRKKGEPIAKTLKRFEKKFIPSLRKFAYALRKDQPELYHGEMLKGAAVQITFFGHEKGEPFAVMRSFMVKEGRKGKIGVDIQRVDCPGNCPGGTIYFALGENAEINQLVQSDPQIWSRMGVAASVKFLVELEEKAHPDRVGGPVDILHLDRTSTSWLQKKAASPEIKPF